MTEEMLDLLQERYGFTLDWSEEYIAQFAEKLAPIVAEFEIMSSASIAIVGLLGILIGVWFIKKCVSALVKVLLVLGIVILLFMVATQSIDIYTALTEPEKLIDTYMTLLQN